MYCNYALYIFLLPRAKSKGYSLVQLYERNCLQRNWIHPLKILGQNWRELAFVLTPLAKIINKRKKFVSQPYQFKILTKRRNHIWQNFGIRLQVDLGSARSIQVHHQFKCVQDVVQYIQNGCSQVLLECFACWLMSFERGTDFVSCIIKWKIAQVRHLNIRNGM